MKKALLVMSMLVFSVMAHGATSKPDASMNGFNAFAFNLYQQTETHANRVISPYSIAALLTYLTAGAANTTQTELLQTLHITNPEAAIQALGQYQKSIAASAVTAPPLLMANAIWIEKSFPCNQHFLSLLQANGANLQPVDFMHAPLATTNEINQWVSQFTKNHIQQLLPPDVITPMTRMVLTNAIYFQGKWEKPFEHAKTAKQLFHVSASNTASVDMMHQRGFFVYAENSQFQYLEMPYQQTSLTMAIMLPKQINTSAFVDDKLFTALHQSAKMQEVELSLPVFKMHSTVDLISPLQNMGITTAFNANKADFSRLLQTPAKQSGLYISAALQKAMIDVDEAGTTAAAASAVVMGLRAVVVAPHPMLTFTADHPFTFILYDKTADVILFIGKVNNPASR